MTTVTVAAKPIGRVIKIWTPEDKTFWVQQGQAIATRNLWISVPALFLAFAVWQLMSVVAVKLPQIGFRIQQHARRSPFYGLGNKPGPRFLQKALGTGA